MAQTVGKVCSPQKPAHRHSFLAWQPTQQRDIKIKAYLRQIFSAKVFIF